MQTMNKTIGQWFLEFTANKKNSEIFFNIFFIRFFERLRGPSSGKIEIRALEGTELEISEFSLCLYYSFCYRNWY